MVTSKKQIIVSHFKISCQSRLEQKWMKEQFYLKDKEKSESESQQPYETLIILTMTQSNLNYNISSFLFKKCHINDR